MPYYDSILGSYGATPGVEPTFGIQDTTAAAKQALQEQQHGDEFKPQEFPDTEALVKLLNELELKCTNLTLQLYGPPNQYMKGTPYKGPPYLEKERLSRELREVESQKSRIQVVLRQFVEATGLATDEGKPFVNPAVKVIGG